MNFLHSLVASWHNAPVEVSGWYIYVLSLGTCADALVAIVKLIGLVVATFGARSVRVSRSLNAALMFTSVLKYAVGGYSPGVYIAASEPL